MDNLAALADLLGIWIDQVNERKPPKIIVLDMDSSVSPTYGDQEGTAYNGHFGCTCYHPLFVFNQFGDLERCALRPGNVHSAHEWRDVLDPVVARYRNKTLRRYFRGDAAFASPEVYEFLEAEGFKYAIRLPANKVLHDSIAHLLKRPVGRPPKEVRRYYANFSYRAGSWTEPRRVVAKVEWHSGELYPRVGLDRFHRSSVTNLSRPAERVVAFYNQRGTAEQWIKEGELYTKVPIPHFSSSPMCFDVDRAHDCADQIFRRGIDGHNLFLLGFLGAGNSWGAPHRSGLGLVSGIRDLLHYLIGWHPQYSHEGVAMTTESRIKELEERIARAEAVNLALLIILQVLVSRCDDFTFIEILERIDIPPTATVDKSTTVIEFLDALSLDIRGRRRHLVNLMNERLSPESSHGGDR